MATIERRPLEATSRPPGAEGDGMDAYPTYRDGPTTPHVATATKPTDIGLPPARRTHASAYLIGLIVFAVVVLGFVLWGAFRLADRSEDVLAPEGAAAPAATAPTSSEPAPDATLNADQQPQSKTGPADVKATPGAVDVPGEGTGAPAQ
jgi:hypothetical protein